MDFTKNLISHLRPVSDNHVHFEVVKLLVEGLVLFVRSSLIHPDADDLAVAMELRHDLFGHKVYLEVATYSLLEHVTQ